MPMVYTQQSTMMRPLARGERTSTQRTHSSPLMDETGIQFGSIHARMNSGKEIRPSAVFIWLILNPSPPPEPGCDAAEQTKVQAMPRLRGKSRRGAAWYRAESRRKRIKHFERALQLATTRRKQKLRSPPMAIIEELSWEEAQQYLASLANQMEPEPQHETARWDLNEPRDEDLHPPCLVEEEIPPEDSGGKQKSERPTSEAAEDSSNHETHASGEPDQHSAADPRYLSLIFELRHLMDDHAFRLARMDQRLDMLFAAYSRSTPKRQCPTCAQAYSLPAGWRQRNYGTTG
jgi:hypothetical protein